MKLNLRLLKSVCSRDPDRPGLLTPYTFESTPGLLFASDGCAMVRVPYDTTKRNIRLSTLTSTLDVTGLADRACPRYKFALPTVKELQDLCEVVRSEKMQHRHMAVARNGVGCVRVLPGGVLEPHLTTTLAGTGFLYPTVVNVGYLLALAQMGFDQVGVVDGLSPIVFRNATEPKALAAVMPALYMSSAV